MSSSSGSLRRRSRSRTSSAASSSAFRNLYAFLSQIIPYQDSELEKLYAFVRNLLAKLPPPGDGQAFALDDEVALRFFRLQQMSEGSIDLVGGRSRAAEGADGRRHGSDAGRSKLPFPR